MILLKNYFLIKEKNSQIAFNIEKVKKQVIQP